VGLLVDTVSALTRPGSERRVDLAALLARDFAGLRHKAGLGAAKPSRSSATEATQIESTATPDALVLVGFALAGQDYALPVDTVLEIRAMPREVAHVPGTDEVMVGVVELRGTLLPLVSLSRLLGLEDRASDRDARHIVIFRMGAAAVGLVVDRMTAILHVPRDAIDPVPPVLNRGRGETRIAAICRLEGGKRLVSVLAPARLFDDETASRIQADAQGGAAQMSATASADSLTEQFVVFRLGTEFYGLPILAVDEVVRCPEHLTRVPGAPAFVEGVMNLRGKVVPVISQRSRFSVPGEAAGGARRVLVVTIDGLSAGFLVDAASEVMAVPFAAIRAAPRLTEADMAADGVRVFDRIANMESEGRMILLIDPKALLDLAERDLLAALAAKVAPAP
jgi:purine-binding chemotaxis protein CheW